MYIALYPDSQSALQHFVGDFARLLIWAQIAAWQIAVHNLIRESSRIHRCPQNRTSSTLSEQCVTSHTLSERT